jgi:Fe-S oxidoreductase
LVKRSALVEETLVVAEAFGAPMGVSRSSSKCCGYPLYAAGAHETFLAHALSVSSAFAETPEVAVLDPGCAFTFRKLYPAFGVQVHSRVRTVVEVLFEHVLHAPHQPKLSLRVGYHDACHLGRGLGQYDEPRSLLSLAVVDVMEAASVRREGGCSGGGGLLPRTMADVSVEVARLQAADVSRESSVAVVSACPTSSRMFERAGRTSMDFIGVLNRWLRQS